MPPQPGGRLVVTTINRSVAAFGLAILAAEYVLRAVPAGTHEWVKFVTPGELRGQLRACGLHVVAETGLRYNPLSAAWSFVADTSVNYAVVAAKDGPVSVAVADASRERGES